MPLNQQDASKLISLRHNEWAEHQRDWRRQYDSLEGGERYRRADYVYDPTSDNVLGVGGWANFATPLGGSSSFNADATTGRSSDISYGQIINRNLIPHPSETSPEGRDLYAMRLERTPVPAFVRLAVQTHLSRIYSREVRRDKAPEKAKAWWGNVDGRGTKIDRWMAETAAPLLSLLGQLDVAITKPAAPKGVYVNTKADQIAANLGDVIASIILPENVINWELDANKSLYEWALTFERTSSGRGYRHWTREACDFYDHDGKYVAEKSWKHDLGFVPMRRYFDQRKPRCENVGVSDYEQIADRSRAFYNLHSEVILLHVLASSPRLQGPEEYLDASPSIPIGPDRILPMKNHMGSGSYAGWSFVDPPQGGADSIRTTLKDIVDEIDRLAGLGKPAGSTTSSTVSQSGVSKIMDSIDANALLAKKADTLQSFENGICAMSVAVASGEWPKPESIDVVYPKQFDLYTASDLAQALDDIARIASKLGALPLLQTELLNRLVTLYMPGLPDTDLDKIREEIEAKVAESATEPPADPTLRINLDGTPFGSAAPFNPVPTSPLATP